MSMEIEVFDWIFMEVQAKHKIGRASIMRKAVSLEPNLAGGPDGDGYIKRLRRWYYGFCDAFEVNPRRKIVSKGQKLPEGDWRARCD